MPTYDIKCKSCQKTGIIFRKLAELNNPLPYCECGAETERLLSAPALRVSFTPYQSPGTGKWIDSPSARDADLKASGAFLYESGVEKDIARQKAHVDEQKFAPIAAGVDNAVRDLVNAGLIES